MSCILIVDDDDDTREALRAVLDDEGFATRTAADGDAAIGDLGGNFIGLALREWGPEPKLLFEVIANSGGQTAPFGIDITNAWAVKFIRAGTIYSVYFDSVLKAQFTADAGPTPANADLCMIYQHEDSDPGNDGQWTVRNLAYYDGLV